MRKHTRTRGSLTVAGTTLDVTYDIPGLECDDADLAGGLIWFEKQDRPLLTTRGPFLLETSMGAIVRGSIASIHSGSAAVVVEV